MPRLDEFSWNREPSKTPAKSKGKNSEDLADPRRQWALDELEAHGFKCVNPKSDWVPPKLPRLRSL